MATTPRSARLQAAATTPYRRSQVELLEQLNSLFDSLPSGSRPTSPLLSLPAGYEQNQPRTAPIRLLPELFAAFERKRGIQLLSVEERTALQEFVTTMPAEVQESPVGVMDVMGILTQLGAVSSSSSSSSEVDEPPKTTTPSDSPTFTRRPSLRDDPLSYTTPNGSPVPRHRRTASNSSLTSLSSPSSSAPGIPSLAFPPASTTPQAPSAASASTTPLRRRSLLSSLSRSSPSASSTSTSKGLRKRRTFENLSALVVQQGGTYLGTGLDGPTGEGRGEGEWDVEGLAERVRGVVGAKALNRDRDLSLLLSPLTFPQLKALDVAYAKANGKSLLEVVTGEKAFKGNVEYALRGLLMGPLGWDVWLLQKALEGATTNDTLLIDLLVSRTPSDLALLRAAYSSRSSSTHSRTPSTDSPSTTSSSAASTSGPASNNLNVAVLSAFSSNIRLRKAWEVALQGRWEDCPEGGEMQEGEGLSEVKEERRKKLLREDLDQLKVALRRGGNIEIVAKILLARSPSHLHSLTLDYRKTVTAGHSSLTKAIKQCITAGTLQKLFLHAVEGAKNASFEGGAGDGKEGYGVGVWRDAKALERAMEVEKGGKREELLWRLVRLHWDRPRFLAVQQAFKQKYRKSLSDRLASAVPAGVLVELTTSLVKSASLPDPTPSAKDQERLFQQQRQQPAADDKSTRSRKSSVSSLASMPEQEEDSSSVAPPSSSAAAAGAESETESVGSESSSPGRVAAESGELEAEGELSDPPSPRSPPVQSDFEFEMDDAGGQGEEQEEEEREAQSTPMLPSFSRVGTPTLPQPSSTPEGGRSVSADRSSGEKGHAKSSSLSFRQRSSPLELVGSHHRPLSSAGGSADSAKLSSSLRHSRPIAPSRAKRRQSDQPRGEREDSEEPLSPSLRGGGGRGLMSPTPSTPSRSQSRADLSRSTSSSNGESLGSSAGSIHSAAIGMGNASMASSVPPEDSFFGSPPTSIDTTSFHAAPLSPNQPADRSSSSFFPGQTPPPSSPPAFDLSAAASDFFATSAHDTPDSSPEKHFSSFLRRQGSTVSTNGSGGPGGGGMGRPSSLFAGEGGLGLPVSIFEGSPAGHMRDGSGGTLGGGEQVQQLLRQANELMRKLKESEARFQASASAYEEQVSDLQDRLEEARSELQAKRREEKELRSVEKEHLAQINTLEADVAKLTKSLERSREQYDAMKRSYTSTCEDAETLRALVAETRRENRAAEEAIQNHALQVQQFERDRDLLQQTINRLEEELSVARRAQDSLDDQKQENLLLKETIDKLRFEIDEMRANARKSQFLDGPLAPGSPAKSLAESLSKSLGREIANQMAAQEEDSESSDEGEDTAGEEDEVDDIIVTTHRRIKKRSKKSPPASAEPVVTHIQTSVSVCDVDIQTDPTEVREMDAQTDLSAVNVDLIAAPAVEPEVVVVEPLPPIKTPQELQLDLAKELGVDVDLVKQFVDASKTGKAEKLIADAVSPPLASPRRSGRWRQRIPMVHAPSVLVNAFPNSARPYVAQVLDSSISLVLYSATLYLLGVVSGSWLLPVNHHHTFAPFQVMLSSHDSAYNTMNWEGLGPGHGGSGYASEGLSDLLYNIVWSGTRIARRIPV